MARGLFLLLVFANLVFFIWAAGYLGARDEGREPERLRNQLQPERLRVAVGGEQAPTASSHAPGTAASAVVCRRVAAMATTDAESVQKAVVAQGGSATQTPADELSYWVYIPPVAGKPSEQDIVLLKAAGIKDYFVVTEEGINRNALSLGLYHKEDAARELMQRLVKKGIKSAKLTTKTRVTGKSMLLVRGTAGMLDSALTGQSAEAVDCPKE
jgi:hypothetical protein